MTIMDLQDRVEIILLPRQIVCFNRSLMYMVPIQYLAIWRIMELKVAATMIRIHTLWL